ncbi:MAG: DM9 repeat-containing protein [Leptolyngbyaceae cyanobacterium]
MIFCQSIRLTGSNYGWTEFTGTIPDQSVYGGSEPNGSPLYVCKTMHNGQWTPGKFSSLYNACYIPYGGNEYRYRNDFYLLIA